MNDPSSVSPKKNSSSISDTSLQRRAHESSKMTRSSDVKNQFFSIVQNRLISATREGRHKAAWRGENAADYSHEMQIFKEHYSSIIWGLSGAFLTFVSFRVSKFTGPLIRRSNGMGFKFQKSPSNKLPPSSWMTRGAKESDKKYFLNNALSIPIDLGLSFLVGFSTTMFLLDYDKLLKDVSHVPLVSGRSFVSHELCGPFIQQYQKIPKDFVQERMYPNSQNQQDYDASLKAIRTFVHNCQRRRIVELSTQQQSLQSGSAFSQNDSSEPIHVSGVPWNIEISEFEDQKVDEWTSEN